MDLFPPCDQVQATIAWKGNRAHSLEIARNQDVLKKNILSFVLCQLILWKFFSLTYIFFFLIIGKILCWTQRQKPLHEATRQHKQWSSYQNLTLDNNSLSKHLQQKHNIKQAKTYISRRQQSLGFSKTNCRKIKPSYPQLAALILNSLFEL